MPAKWKPRKSWREKMETEREPKLVPMPARLARKHGKGKLLIPRPLDLDRLVRRIPKGKVATLSLLRARLARDAGAASTCPLCAGIFLRITAEVAEEDLRAGARRITPYWRVVKDDGSLHERLPGGTAGQARRLASEGHDVEPARGKRPPKVRDLERSLARI